MTEPNPSKTTITPEALRSCRWSQAGEQVTYHALSERLRALAQDAEKEGAASEALALDLLADLCGMGLDSDGVSGPFYPFFQSADGGRTLVPEDLLAEHVTAVAALAEEPGIPSLLRARLADTAWLRVMPRNPKYARLAIDAYRTGSPASDRWFKGQREEWLRATRLCLELGKDCAERLSEIEAALLRIVDEEPPVSAGFLRSVAEALAACGLGNARRAGVAAKLEKVAQDLESRSNWSQARELLLESAKWHTKAGDSASSARATARAAEMWVREGEFYERSSGTGYMMAGAAYESAVQLFRSVPRKYRVQFEVDDRLADLRRRLRECNDRSLDAMEPFSGESVDISELVASSRKAVSGKEAWAALVAFASLSTPLPPSHWRDQAAEAIKEYPLQALFTSTRLSTDGRLVARSPGLNFREVGSPAWEKAIDDRAIQAHGFYQSLLVQGAILPALDAMSLEHRLTEADFVTLAQRSPVVPQGRERMFGRGLCAGYRRDFAVAVHLLAPQIEHIVRMHVVAVGGETRKLDASGVETEIGLSALMELPEIQKIFGAALAFELRSVFCDAAGPNLRNVLAHGLLDDAEIVTASSVYAWWFCLRLAMMPFLKRKPAGEGDAPKPDNDDAPAEKPS